MSTMKPIQATPVLRGKDAMEVIKQTNKIPTESTISRNKMLSSILKKISK